MARDLSFLRGPLAITEEGLASVDPRLVVLADLAARSRYAEAADKAAEIATEGTYDIRPLSYYLYQAVLEGGFRALGDVLDVVVVSLGENFTAIGPTKKREENFDKRLSWLLETLAQSLEYHELKQTPEWTSWQPTASADALQRCVAVATTLADVLALGPYSNASRGLGLLSTWLRAHEGSLAPSSETSASKNEIASVEPARAEARKAGGASMAKGRRGGKRGVAEDASFDAGESPSKRVEIAVSHQFIELCNKLRAFELLIEKGQFEKAALVSDDLVNAIESFDPRVYFPEMFARFSAQLSKNVPVLSEHWEHKGTVGWKALDQYYRVDLKSFLES